MRSVSVVCLLVLSASAPGKAQPHLVYQQLERVSENDHFRVALFGQRAFATLEQKLREKPGDYNLLRLLARTRHPGLEKLALRLLADPGTRSPRQRRFVREQALEILRRWRHKPEVARAAAAVLSDPRSNRFVKEEALQFLIEAPSSEAVAQLIAFDKTLKGRNTERSNLCGRALVAAGTPQALAYLKDKLSDTSRAYLPWYGHIAVEAGRRRRAELLEPLLEAARVGVSKRRTVVPDVYRALGLMGDRRAVPVLIAALEKKDFRIRYWAARSLGLLADQRAREPLRRTLERVVDYPAQRRWVNRAAIAYALARLGDAEGNRLLRQAYSTGQESEKVLAAMFLSLIAGSGRERLAWAEKLVAEVRPYADIDGCPRHPWEQIVFVLAAIDDERAVELLLEMADWKKAAGVRYWARRALDTLPPERVAPVLARRLLAGAWAERLQAAEQLEQLGGRVSGQYLQVYRRGDTQARLLALRQLAFFHPREARQVLERAARDKSWQVREEARRLRHWLAGGKPWPQGAPTWQPSRDELIGYRPAAQQLGGSIAIQGATELARPPVRRLSEDSRGTIWAATAAGLMSYDGMQWRVHQPSDDRCGRAAFDLAWFKGELWVAAERGLQRLHGSRLECLASGRPVLRLAAGRELYLGTGNGVARLAGQSITPLDGQPRTGLVDALAVSPAGELWVHYAGQNGAGRAGGSLHVRRDGRWQSRDELLRHYYGLGSSKVGAALVPEPVTLFDLVPLPGRRALGLATDWGLVVVDRRGSRLAGGEGYWPWLPVRAAAEAGDSLWLGCPGLLLEVTSKRARPRALPMARRLGGPEMAPHLAAAVHLLASRQGELWLVPWIPVQLPGGELTPATVVRRPVRDRRERLPPETAIAALAAGGIRIDNPDTVLTLPNRARKFAGGEAARLPGAMVSVTAVAKDPWDFDPVEYRFKIDEQPWTQFAAKNTLVTQRILDEGVHRVLAQARDARGNVDPSPAEARFTVVTSRPTVVQIESGQFERIFPAQLLRYQQRGLGRVLLKNTSDQPVKVNLRLHIEDLFEKPAELSCELPPRANRWVDAPAPLTERLLGRRGGGQVSLVVEASYRWQEAERSTRRSFPVEVLEASALSWSEPRSLAAFINPRDPAVEKLAAEINRALAENHPALARRSHPLRRLALVLYTVRALERAGIVYKSDPARPFAAQSRQAIDTVQIPAQTVARHSGDCDDLTVLVAALLENLGVDTAVATVEGHVFPMFDTGIHPGNDLGLPLPARLAERRGETLWLPLETTLLGKGRKFVALVEEAARHREHQLFVVAEAWNDFPAAGWPVAGAAQLAVGDLGAAARELAGLQKQQAQRLEQRLAGKQGQEALAAKARALLEAGSFAAAERSYRELLASGDSFEWRYGLAAALAGRGQLLEAMMEFKRSEGLARDGRGRFRALLSLAQCYRADGNLEKARSYLERALKVNPAARYDSRYRPLVQYLTRPTAGKAASGDDSPPLFQFMIDSI